MVSKIKVLLPIIGIIMVVLFSGCTSQKPVKDLSPEDVVTTYWNDIAKGDYSSAYELAYHANQNLTKQMWIDEHISTWGANGTNIKIYSFNVTDSYPINASDFEGNFTEARIVNTNATIAYRGQNETGQLRMVLVNSTDGWKVFGNN